MNPELIVIIPVYNEEEIITTVVQDWQDELDKLEINYQIKVYNDGSKDRTKEVLDSISASDDKFLIIHKENSGHGPTILQGYRDSLDATWIFQVDSDNEMRATHFNSLWKLRDQFDFLIGKRVHRKNSLMRSLMTRISASVIRKHYGKGLVDVNCPYRLFRTESFSKVIDRIPEDTFAPNLIISGMTLKKGLRYKQIPIEFEERSTGESSLNSDYVKLLKIAYRSFRETIRFSKMNS